MKKINFCEKSIRNRYPVPFIPAIVWKYRKLYVCSLNRLLKNAIRFDEIGQREVDANNVSVYFEQVCVNVVVS